MKIIITGSRGMAGRCFIESLKDKYDIYAFSKEELDITQRDSVIKTVKKIKPDIVIHCAAFTDVDGCEKDKKKAYHVNALGSEYVATGCFEAKSAMIYISTDFIFDGKKRLPYSEMDTPFPLNVYAETKLLGEYFVSHILNRFIIVRTSRIFGRKGKNFASSLPILMKKQKQILLTTDLVDSPTYIYDLTSAIEFLVRKDFCGIVNVCNKGSCSWYEYGLEIQKILKLKKAEIIPVSFSNFAKTNTANRPSYSVLNTEFLEHLGFSMPEWEVALRCHLLS